MGIEIQRASNLGQIHQSLGIAPDARISISELYGNQQFDIWDLSTGRYFAISPREASPVVEERFEPVPSYVEAIVNTPDGQLIHDLSTGRFEQGSDEHLTAFTELRYRGINAPM